MQLAAKIPLILRQGGHAIGNNSSMTDVSEP